MQLKMEVRDGMGRRTGKGFGTGMRRGWMGVAGLAGWMILAAACAPARAAEPLFESLERQLKHDWLRVGSLLQVGADVQPDRNRSGENGFRVANLRVSAKGELDEGFSYAAQVNFRSSPALLDARLSYEAAPSLTLDAGAMKAPFSAEVLISSSKIDFVKRSQAASLAPGRQIGANLRGAIAGTDLSYAVGVFNGNGIRPNGNDGEGLLGVGRLQIEREIDEGSLQMGFNAALGKDDDISVGPFDEFSGDRSLIGADARIEQGRLLGSAELVWASLDPSGSGSVEPWGFQITGGTMVSERVQVLGRLDSFDPAIGDWSHVLVAGMNAWPTRVTKFQVNLLFPTDESLRHAQLLVNAQLAL